MITQGDDYPIHQTPEPVQQVFTSDRNFYDRFFFNGYFREGEPYFAAAMGIYPNIGMIDCAFSVIVGGVQHCVRASRVLGAERLDTRVGPRVRGASPGDRGAALHPPQRPETDDGSDPLHSAWRLQRQSDSGGQDLRRESESSLGFARSLLGRAQCRAAGSGGPPGAGDAAVFLAVVADQFRRHLHALRCQRKRRRIAMARIRLGDSRRSERDA